MRAAHAIASLHSLQERVSDRAMLSALFLASFVYLLSIALLHGGKTDSGFTFAMSLAFAILPLLAGFAIASPSAICTGFFLACLGPFQKTTLLIAFATGLLMLGITLHGMRWRLWQLLRTALRERDFAFLAIPFLYIATVWALRLGDSTDAWSLLALSASLCTVPFAVYSLLYLSWTEGQQRSAILSIAVVLAALGATVLARAAIVGDFAQYGNGVYVYAKALAVLVPMHWMPAWVNPDANSASLRSAHYMAVMMLTLAAALFCYGAISRRLAPWAALALIALYISGMGENAHILGGVAAGALSVVLAVLLRSRIPNLAIAVLIMGVAISGIVAVGARLYFGSDPAAASPKAHLFSESISYVKVHPWRLLLGEGPAAYSSLAARKRLPAALTDEDPFPLLPVFAAPGYRGVLDRVHVPETPTTAYRAMSGVVGILMEWGLAGTLLLGGCMLLFVSRLVRGIAGEADAVVIAARLATMFLLVLLSVASLFRPYFEYQDVMSLLCLGVLLSAKPSMWTPGFEISR